MVLEPYPGSDKAIEAGCICPVMDNHRGQGAYGTPEYGFWITEGCPVHGET